MRDLLLWRALAAESLAAESPPADDLAAQLELLAERPLAMRAPFFAGLLQACRDRQPAVRAAALAALAGGTGRETVQALVRGLGDDEPAVWQAAVRGLVANAETQPLRLVHALYHRNVAVRLAAIAAPLPPRTRLLTLPLLADPECRAAVLAGLPADLPLGRDEVALILGLFGAGDIPAPVTADLLGTVAGDMILSTAADSIEARIDRGPSAADTRPEEAVRLLNWLADRGPDTVDMTGWAEDPRWVGDELVTLALRHAAASPAGRAAAGDEAAGRDGLDRLLASVAGLAPSDRTWLAFGCCRRLLLEGTTGADAELLIRGLVAAWPQAALWRWLPVGARRRAARVFLGIDAGAFGGWTLADDAGPLSADRWLAAIGASDIATEGGRIVAAGALAGLARLAGEDPLRAVRRQFGWPRLCDAVFEPGGTVLLALPGSEKTWTQFTDELHGRLGGTPEKTACLIPFLNDRTIGLIEAFTPEQMLATLAALQRLSPQPPIKDPRGRRLRRIVERVAERLLGDAGRRSGVAVPAAPGEEGDAVVPAAAHQAMLAAFVDAWQAGPRGPVDRLFLAIMTELGRLLTPPLLHAAIDQRAPGVAVQVLLTHDPLKVVDAALARTIPAAGPADAVAAVDDLLGVAVGGLSTDARAALPLAAHLWRAAWETHAAFALARLRDECGDQEPLAWLVEAAGAMACRPLAARSLRFIARQLQAARVRDRAAFLELATPSLAAALVAALIESPGPEAAVVLTAWHGCDADSPELEAVVPAVTRLLPDLSPEAKSALEPWVSSRGLFGPGDRSESGESGAGTGATAGGDEADGRAVADRFETLLASGRAAEALDLAAGETTADWFRGGHWDALAAAGLTEILIARRLATASQPYAGIRAVETLVTEPALTAADRAALEAFLECGDRRLASLRIEAARSLSDAGNPVGVPLLVTDLISTRRDETERHPWGVPRLRPAGESPARPTGLFRGATPRAARDLIRSVIAALPSGAGSADHEKSLHRELLAPGVTGPVRAAGMAELIAHGTTRKTIDAALAWHRRSASMDERIRTVAEIFAWGIRRGRELAGRTLRFEMIAAEGLGYTSLDTGRVAINILPILLDVPDGTAIVRGLVIHEIGHHVYHVSPAHRLTHTKAGGEGLFQLLNLVLDEHLERNLRAVHASFGDPLKQLNAYAFQHFGRAVEIRRLLKILGRRAAAVLTRTRLAAGPDPETVVIQTGSLLKELARGEVAFARFVRALRMGLGRRDAHPQVSAGLALFGPQFRESSADELLGIARELRRIFGSEVALLDLFVPEWGPLSGDPEDPVRVGEGLTPAELRRAVEAAVFGSSTPRSPPRPSRGWQSRKPGFDYNRSEDERFNPITDIVPVPYDADRSRTYRRALLPAARRLRRFFAGLGLTAEPVRPRLHGRLLDRTRLAALAARGEPRVMIARRFAPRTDLFIGVAIDCSGSMSEAERFPTAVVFGELLAEAVRGLAGIELRVIGFNDKQIFDAGTAAACAAHGLEVGGGNNDAAALWHLANLALASHRRNALLIMISDGLPTECSVAALRKLVTVLTRRFRMACAQVAVAPIEAVCFPTFLEVESLEITVAARQFGRLVARLVKRMPGMGG